MSDVSDAMVLGRLREFLAAERSRGARNYELLDALAGAAGEIMAEAALPASEPHWISKFARLVRESMKRARRP